MIHPLPPGQGRYDGSFVVPHAVRSGETLQGIAQAYRFASWQPIWTYNVKVEKTLGDNPNLVRAGVAIFIPRSREGYDKLIRKMEATRHELVASNDALLYSLEADWYELQATKVAIDTVGAIATTAVTLWMKAASAARAAATAERTLGQARIAARHAARTEGSALAKDFAELRSRRLKSALKDHQGMRQAQQALHSDIRSKAVDAGAKAADAMANRADGGDGTPFTHAKNAARAGQTLKQVAEKTITLAQGLGSAAEIALDYLDPSTLTEGYLWLTTGQTTGQAYEEAQKTIRQTSAMGAASIGRRIDALRQERQLLYGA